MRSETRDFGVLLLVMFGIVAGFAVLVAVVVDQNREACEDLRRLYGPGRCVIVRGDDPKIILPDGTARYLPAQAERQP